MPKYRRKNVKLWGSILPEATYNTSPGSASDYEAFVTTDPVIILPAVDKATDAGRAGTGTPFPTHACNEYWRQSAFALSTDLEFYHFFGRLWLRAFGGTVVTTEEGTGWLHEAELQKDDDGTQLPGTSMISKLGPLDVLVSGLTVDQAILQKQRKTRPTLAVNLIGTGKHARPAGVSDLVNYSSPSVCGGRGNITVKYTNASSTVVDLGASGCKFVELNVGVQNQLVVGDACPGDPELTVNGATANHVRGVPRTDQIIPASFTFLLDSSIPEHDIYVKNEEVTSVQIGIKGPVIGAGPTRYELGIRFPKAVFIDAAETDSDGDAAFAMTLQPLYDGVTDSVAVGYVINDVEENFK